MTTTKLTPDDVAWLERRLARAIEPIEPSRDFVNRARREWMEIEPDRPLPTWVKPSVLMAVILSLLALVGMLLYLHQRPMADE